jgi:hypothetical protein
MDDKFTCTECGERKEYTGFFTAGVKNGKRYRRRKCKSCYSKVKKAYLQEKLSWYTNIKKNLRCDVCGYSNLTSKSFSTKALQFHHHRSDKSFAVSEGAYLGFSKEKIIQEIKKCKVLCSRCHAEEHDKLNTIN